MNIFPPQFTVHIHHVACHWLSTHLRAVVDGLVGGDGDGEELAAELEHRLVLEDDGAPVLASALHAQLVRRRDVVARRDLRRSKCEYEFPNLLKTS